MNPWKNVHELEGWSGPWSRVGLIGLLLAGCDGEASDISTHRPVEAVARDGGSPAPSHAVSSSVAADDAGGIPPALEQQDSGPAPVTPPPFEGDSEPPLSWSGAPLYSDYVRLTHPQWDNSVMANLRLDAPTGFLTSVSPDVLLRYSNNEEMLLVRSDLAFDYQAAAARIAERVTADAEALGKVSTTREPEPFIAEVGRRFYRRPLTSAERATYLALYETGASLPSAGRDEFAAGVQLLLEVWMQAPSFLYRVEHSEGLLNGYELATRLAFLLTDTTPSDALLAAAEAGELDTAAGVTRAAAELIASDEAALVFRRFHDETYGLRGLTSAHFDDSFGLPTDVGSRVLEATHAFFDRQWREHLGLRELFLSQTGFTDAELAGLYDVPPSSADGPQPFTLGDSRRGVFAQLSFLMLGSAGETPGAFRRGATFAKHVLCLPLVQAAEVPPPLPTPLEPGLSNRERASQVVASSACTVCHRYMDPFGFAFENFDGLGRQRTEDNGRPVDTTGVYPFAPSKPFADSTELMAILAESPLAHDCYAKNLTEFALARTLTEADAVLVEQLGALSFEQDAPLTGLVEALVGSETFRSSGGTP